MDQEIIDEFFSESKDHLDIIEETLLKLEHDCREKETINRLFRAIHSIKGGAGFFGLLKITELAHSLENLLYKARNDELILDAQHIDILFAGLDKLRENFSNPEADISIDDVQERLARLPGIQETHPHVEIQGKAFDKNDPRFQKFKIKEKDLAKAAEKGMHIYAVRAFLKKDMHDKDKTPYQYTEQINQLGFFIDSYLDIDTIPEDKDFADFDLPFVFLFATVMDENLVVTGVEVDASQIISIDTSAYKKKVQVKDKDGSIIDVKEKGKEIDSGLKSKRKSEAGTTPAAPPALLPETAAYIDETLRVKVSQLNKLVNLAGELVLARNQLFSISREIHREVPGLHGILQRVDMVTTKLQTEIMNARMQPISLVFSKFPRLVRDFSRKLGKKIRLEMTGTEVEVDKSIIEAISDPLTHMVRNVADHGIETPKQRRELGKGEEGLLRLRAYHEGGLVHMEISDDGKGIDPEDIIEKAIKKQLVTPAEAGKLSTKEKINFIFCPGFSTAAVVTDASGRGVGMDVVKTNIEKLGGSVDIESRPGKGTTVKLTLPLTLAIITALIVETEKERFAIPQVSIEELLRVKPEEFDQRIANIQGGQVLRIRGKLLPLIHLADGIGLPRTFTHPETAEILPEKRKRYSNLDITAEGEMVAEAPGKNGTNRRIISSEALRILIVKSGLTRFAIIVDKIEGSEEIVVKPMPHHFRHLKSYAGSTILGDGRVALIIDIPGLAEKNKFLFRETDTLQAKQEAPVKPESPGKTKSVNLLYFDLGTGERYAVPVELVERVDVLDNERIEIIGGKYYSSYKGYSMRLVRLTDHLPMQQSAVPVDRYRVVIPKNVNRPVGILIHRIIDAKETIFQLEEGLLKQKGIIGSAVIDNKITLLLDLPVIINEAEPKSMKTPQKPKETKNE